MAPRNVAFVVLGWLYGEDDFGKSICAAVNCGDDTDCTGATLGSLLGIIHGSKFISEKWRKPVGESIVTIVIGGFTPPATIGELTDQTVAVTKRVLAERNAPVIISADKVADEAPASELKLTDSDLTKELWSRSPYQFVYELGEVRATLDLLSDPEIQPATPKKFELTLENRGSASADISATWKLDPTLTATPANVSLNVPTKGRIRQSYELISAPYGSSISRGKLELAVKGHAEVSIPISLMHSQTLSTNMALASLGAKATSDSELESDPGCTARIIDGVVPTKDFFTHRWHSALTPHPHWIAVELPSIKTIGRFIIHFADTWDRPMDLRCELSRDGVAWQTVAEEKGGAVMYVYEKSITPAEAKMFRLTILKSVERPYYANAAQIAEIELLPR